MSPSTSIKQQRHLGARGGWTRDGRQHPRDGGGHPRVLRRDARLGRFEVEEVTETQWLHDLLTPLVERVIVRNRRGQWTRGNKADALDADASSELLWQVLQPVYHASVGWAALKEPART